MDRKIEVRRVTPDDAERLVEIYSYYVENTAVSFEYQTPSVEEFRKRIETTIEKYPYLVCEVDGVIEGYVYAEAYSSREAYNQTVTSSIYVDKDYRRMGIGSILYDRLEKELIKQGVVNILAGIAYTAEEDMYLTHDSYKFHLKEGYFKVAHMPEIGIKFDRWYDLLWMQKVLKCRSCGCT